MIKYLKDQVPGLVQGLPDEVRGTARWALGGFRETGNVLDFGLFANDTDAVASVLRPLANLVQPGPEGAEGTWLGPAYHHRRGILPTHDAMIIGTHSRLDFFDHYMRFDLHPYVAQNYFSSRSYCGTDITLDLSSPADTTRIAKPWGRIVVSYTNGDNSMMDHGRGFDLHGELHFSDRLSLNSGVRQSDTTGSGNYVLLQWKMTAE